MPKRLTLFTTGVLFFFLFVFFSYLVHKDLFTQFDFNTTVRLQDRISRRFDDIFSLFSIIGSFEPMLILLIGVFAAMRKWIGGISALFLFGMFHVFELYGKFFVDHTPPPEFMLRTKKLAEFPQFHIRAENSYPSGHAGRAMFLSSILILFILRSKRLSPVAKYCLLSTILLYDIVMLISRIYLGEHWASDVIGGAILGLSFGVVTYVAATISAKRLFSSLRR